MGTTSLSADQPAKVSDLQLQTAAAPVTACPACLPPFWSPAPCWDLRCGGQRSSLPEAVGLGHSEWGPKDQGDVGKRDLPSVLQARSSATNSARAVVEGAMPAQHPL